MTFLLKQVRVPRAKVNFTSEINQTHGNQNLPLYGPLTLTMQDLAVHI